VVIDFLGTLLLVIVAGVVGLFLVFAMFADVFVGLFSIFKSANLQDAGADGQNWRQFGRDRLAAGGQ
jgi:hypothetical protein